MRAIEIEDGFEHDPTLQLQMDGDAEATELHWSDLVQIRVLQQPTTDNSNNSSNNSNNSGGTEEDLSQMKQKWLDLLNV